MTASAQCMRCGQIIVALWYNILCISNVLLCHYFSDTEAFEACFRLLRVMWWICVVYHRSELAGYSQLVWYRTCDYGDGQLPRWRVWQVNSLTHLFVGDDVAARRHWFYHVPDDGHLCAVQLVAAADCRSAVLRDAAVHRSVRTLPRTSGSRGRRLPASAIIRDEGRLIRPAERDNSCSQMPRLLSALARQTPEQMTMMMMMMTRAAKIIDGSGLTRLWTTTTSTSTTL